MRGNEAESFFMAILSWGLSDIVSWLQRICMKVLFMLTDILYSILPSLAAFVLIMVVARLMGRKAISQMTFFDFCVAITLGSVTANIGFGGDNSFHSSVTVLITLGLLAIITDCFHIKSMKFRKLVNSEPLILIENNQIVEANMKKARISLTNLNSMLRGKNAFNISDVNDAVLENDGKLSVQFKSSKRPATPADLQVHPPETGLTRDIVIDGEIMYENLKATQLTEAWLLSELEAKGIGNIKEVFFAALDSSGGLYVSKGIRGREKPGEHGIE
jgi:uncharacterized membrane protein YcaP (DUF421 family)